MLLGPDPRHSEGPGCVDSHRAGPTCPGVSAPSAAAPRKGRAWLESPPSLWQGQPALPPARGKARPCSDLSGPRAATFLLCDHVSPWLLERLWAKRRLCQQRPLWTSCPGHRSQFKGDQLSRGRGTFLTGATPASVGGTGEDRAEPRTALGAGRVLFSRAELWGRREVVPAFAPCCASWGKVLALSEPWVLTCTPRRLRAQGLLGSSWHWIQCIVGVPEIEVIILSHCSHPASQAWCTRVEFLSTKC